MRVHSSRCPPLAHGIPFATSLDDLLILCSAQAAGIPAPERMLNLIPLSMLGLLQILCFCPSSHAGVEEEEQIAAYGQVAMPQLLQTQSNNGCASGAGASAGLAITGTGTGTGAATATGAESATDTGTRNHADAARTRRLLCALGLLLSSRAARVLSGDPTHADSGCVRKDEGRCFAN